MFKHLQKLAIPPNASSWFEFYQLEGRPRLNVRPTGEVNKRYMNHMFKKSKSVVRRMRGGTMTVDLLEETRDIDLELYPQHVVLGWEGVVDDGGQSVTFTTKNLEMFLRALPSEIFDDLRGHCADLENFRGEDGLSDTDVEDIAGN